MTIRTKLTNSKLRLITRRWRVVAMLDFDTFATYRAFPERARFIVRTFRLSFSRCRMRRYRTKRGWHVVVWYYSRRPLKPVFVVAVQAILGSDSKRETFNLYRAVRLKDAPREWRKMGRWNTLYSAKMEERKNP